MDNVQNILKAVRQVKHRQSLINFVGIFMLFLATIILTLLVSLFLLKSPWYLLIGLVIFLFYRPIRTQDQIRAIDDRCALKGRLVNCLQFADYSRDAREGYSQELIAAYIDRALKQIDTRQFKNAVDTKPARIGIQILLAAIIVFLMYPAFLPARFWYSLNHEISWVVIPGDWNFKENAKHDISLVFNGVYYPRYVKFVRQEDAKISWVTVPVKDGKATTVSIVKNSFQYYFEFLNRKTETHQISMIAPIVITDLKFELVYPPYTGLKAETKTGRQIIAPHNTRISFIGHTNQNLKKAILIYNDTIPLTSIDKLFKGEFTIDQSGTAYIELEAVASLKEALILYSIPDLPPLVDIFDPGQNINMPDGMMLDVGVRVSDDYGIRSGKICYNFKQEKSHPLKLRTGVLEDTIFFKWSLVELNLLPGDQVSYYVEAADNAGNITHSATYYVYFPTLEQLYDAIHREEDELADQLDQSIDEQYKSSSELERIEQNLLKNRELSWADHEKLRELLDRDKDLLNRIEDWQAELEQTIEKINESMILDPKALSNLQELLNLLNEIAPQELREAIEKLQQRLDQNPRHLDDAIKDLKQHQDDIKQALERTLEILKRYQQEEKLRQLAAATRALAEKTDSLARDKQIQDDQTIKSIQEKIHKLAQEIKTLSDSKGLEQEIKTNLNEIALNMESTTQNDEMTGMSKNLDDAAADLEKLYEQLVKGRGDKLQEKLHQILGQLIAISQEEENLLTGANNQKFNPARQDLIIRSTKVVAESLFSEEKRSLYVTPTMGKKIARAADLMEKAKTDNNYHNSMQEAMQSVNQVACELLKNLEKASTGKSSTGADKIMEQLSNISQSQLSINQGTSSLLPLPVSGMSAGLKEQMQRLASSQQKLRQAMSALQQAAGSEPYQELFKKLAEDMQSVEEDLFQYKIDRQLIERQNQILTRLLDTEKSIRREDYEEKRKSKTGQDIITELPQALPDRLGQNELRALINQAFKESYPQEYELYIRKYFEQLPDLQ